MAAGLVVAGIVVLAVVVLALRWRSQSGEQHALRHYQNALDTLRTVNDRLESTRPEVVARPQVERDPQPRETVVPPWSPRPRVTAPSQPSATARASPPSEAREERKVEDRVEAPVSPQTEHRPDHGKNGASGTDESLLVFDAEEGPPRDGSARAEAPTRATVRALQRSSRPPSRLPAVLGVLLFVILIVVAAILIVGKHHPGSASPTTASHHRPSTSPSDKVTTTTSTIIPTTTTLPPQVAPETGTASTQEAEYAVPADTYKVTLTSTGPCWVYAALASTGNVVWTGVLDAGQSQVLQADGQLDVQLGHANTMDVTMNGVNVEYPTGYQAVFTLKFVPGTV